jgi:transitional endoplasmic reticulum ATPase
MDGVEGREGVIVVAATNRSELIDTALLRPGRFDMVVELAYPNKEERLAIFAIHTRGRPLAPDITMEELANLTEGRSGADIEAICRRAALLALREWIAPRLSASRVQVTEEFEHDDNEPGSTPTVSSTTPAPPVMPSNPFTMRAEQFAIAIGEQRERYSVQEAAEDVIMRKETGRQRLLDMATDLDQQGKKPLRGFRLWLARLFGLV